MSNTVTAIYPTRQTAELVRTRLAEIGVSGRHVHVVSEADRYEEIDMLHLPADEAATYRQAVQQGHSVVSAEVEDAHIAEAKEAMRHPEEAVDIDAYETEYRASPDYAETERTAATDGEEVIAVAEERLTLGKRVTEGGTAHVRTYVQEVPVEERIRLREERLTVYRQAVGERVVTGADADALFAERDLEITTRSEEAVVGKETVVTEEVVVGKEVTEREEVVTDTVRKTDVEVDGVRERS